MRNTRHTFCKAYRLGDLRQFPNWSESPDRGNGEDTDETICFIWEDFTVVQNPLEDTPSIFSKVTPEWQEFCRTTLHFSIPQEVMILSPAS